MASAARRVAAFTRASGFEVPETPRPMTWDETHFVCSMIVDELLELLATVLPPQDAKYSMLTMVMYAKNVPQARYPIDAEGAVSQIADQVDAIVDLQYYALNATAKMGVDASRVFDLVHAANMAKRDPATGAFPRDPETGKILKPAGWAPPDVADEIRHQIVEGAWPACDDAEQRAGATEASQTELDRLLQRVQALQTELDRLIQRVQALVPELAAPLDAPESPRLESATRAFCGLVLPRTSAADEGDAEATANSAAAAALADGDDERIL